MIPDYQTLMLPLLKYVGDGKEHRIGDVIDPLAKQLSVSDAEKAEMLPSGKQTIFSNRVHWAKTYMAQAQIIGNHSPRALPNYRTGPSGLKQKPQQN